MTITIFFINSQILKTSRYPGVISSDCFKQLLYGIQERIECSNPNLFWSGGELVAPGNPCHRPILLGYVTGLFYPYKSIMVISVIFGSLSRLT